MSNTNLAVTNIVKIHDSNMVERAINLFMNKKLADNTKTAYRNDILQYFDVEDFSMITDKMIRSVDAMSAMEYFNSLEETYTSATAARKLSSMKALFNFINTCRVKGNDSQLLVDGFNPFNAVEITVQNNEYGSFTEEEAIEIIKIAMKEDGVFYELLGKTSVRKEAIRALNINENFIEDQGMWCIHGFDKGRKGIRKPFKKAIGIELYNSCKELANKNPDGKVFTFGENTPLNRLKGSSEDKYENGYCYKIGISQQEYKDRNLCIHSFKKTGGVIVAQATNGNTAKIMQQCNNGAKYAMETYQKVEYNPYDDPSNLVQLRGKECGTELDDRLKTRSAYELRQIILGLDKGVRDAVLGMLIREDGSNERNIGDVDEDVSYEN